MKNKLDYLQQLISQDNLLFFGLNETWLTNNISSSFLTTRSHLIMRQDRIEGRGSGVALYYNSLFSSNVIMSHLDYTTGIDSLLLNPHFLKLIQ